MKLSLSILAEKLDLPIENCHFSMHADAMIYSRPIFLTKHISPVSDTLYMSYARDLPTIPAFEKGFALLSIGLPPVKYFNAGLNLLILQENEDLLEVSNRIHAIYDFFDSWDAGLMQSSNEWNPLKYILEISEPVFGNGLSVMDSNYNIVAETTLNRIGYQEALDEYGTIPIDQVNAFKNDLKYSEITTEKDVFLFPAEILPHRCICKNIFFQDEFIFRIILSETTQTFKESDFTLIEYLSSYIEDISNPLNSIKMEEPGPLASLFISIVSGYSYNESSFKKEIHNLGWKQDQTYRMMYIQPSSQDIHNATMYYFCSKIMREYNQSFAFNHNNIIFVIVNISRIKVSREVFFSEFNYFIREGNFRVGFSNYFESFKNLKEYAAQARIALEIGLTDNPTVWTHTFSENVFLYILRKITDEFPADFLYSPVIFRLKKYDEDNQTDYLRTLQVYLHNQMNAVQSAKELFIHRATMVYRIDRIKEIGKTNLHDPDELLHLYLSMRLIQAHGSS